MPAPKRSVNDVVVFLALLECVNDVVVFDT